MIFYNTRYERKFDKKKQLEIWTDTQQRDLKLNHALIWVGQYHTCHRFNNFWACGFPRDIFVPLKAYVVKCSKVLK